MNTSAGLAVLDARPRSILTALAWKEWRQQRWVFLAAAVLPVLAYLPWANRLNDDTAAAIAAVVLLGMQVVLGASVFCGEDDDRTAHFVATLPVRPATLFLVKIAVLLPMGLIAWGLLSAVVPMCAGRDLGDRALADARFMSQNRGFLLTLTVFAAALPGVVSLWTKRTIACCLASAATLVVIGFVLGVVTSCYDTEAAAWPWLATKYRAPLFAVEMLSAIAVSGIVWCWGRTRRTLIKRIAAGGLAILALALLPATPSLGYWVYITAIASPNAFEQHAVRWSFSRAQAAAGEMVEGEWRLVACDLKGPDRYVSTKRAALVNQKTGRARWLSHARSSEIWAGYTAYNPILVVTKGPMLRPGIIAQVFGKSDETKRVTALQSVDLATGDIRDLQRLFPEVRRLIEMKPRHVRIHDCSARLSAVAGEDRVVFLDLVAMTASECLMPRDFASNGWVLGGLYRTHSGVFADCGPSGNWMGGTGKREGALLEFTPDRTEARLVSGDASTIMGKCAFSDDHNWMACAMSVPGSVTTREVHVTSLRTGETTVIPIRVGADSWDSSPARMAGFIPQQRGILFCGESVGLTVYDPETKTFSDIPADLPKDMIPVHATCSTSGRYALVDVQPPKAAVEYLRELGQRVPGYRIVVELETGRTRTPLEAGDWGFGCWAAESDLLLGRHGKSREFALMRPDGTLVRKLPLMKGIRGKDMQ